jgi:hypothetical protein
MTPIQLLLSALADFARNRKYDDIAEYLDLAGTISKATADDRAKFEALTAEIQAMVGEGRGPNEDERETVRSRRRELSEQIQGLGSDGGG